MRRFFALVIVCVGIGSLSVCLVLLAGTQGWIELPAVVIEMEPVVILAGTRSGSATATHDEWFLVLYPVGPLPGSTRFMLVVPVAKQLNRKEPWPTTIHLW